MRILVSNDDGVHAEGIRALSEALRACGEVIVVAPDRNRSGASHSLTLEVPLRVTRISETGYYAVKGTPTDCVHLAVNELVRPEPDMVVAGINHGANLGDDVIYSGTVAAATEGRHLGYPSIAISLVEGCFQHFDPLRFPEIYDSITPQDVLDFIREHICRSRAALSVIYPKED